MTSVRDKSRCTSEMCSEYSLPPQSQKIRLDVHSLPVSVTIPREAGLLHFGVRSTYIWDCKLAQFCPA